MVAVLRMTMSSSSSFAQCMNGIGEDLLQANITRGPDSPAPTEDQYRQVFYNGSHACSVVPCDTYFSALKRFMEAAPSAPSCVLDGFPAEVQNLEGLNVIVNGDASNVAVNVQDGVNAAKMKVSDFIPTARFYFAGCVYGIHSCIFNYFFCPLEIMYYKYDYISTIMYLNLELFLLRKSVLIFNKQLS